MTTLVPAGAEGRRRRRRVVRQVCAWPRIVAGVRETDISGVPPENALREVCPTGSTERVRRADTPRKRSSEDKAERENRAAPGSDFIDRLAGSISRSPYLWPESNATASRRPTSEPSRSQTLQAGPEFFRRFSLRSSWDTVGLASEPTSTARISALLLAVCLPRSSLSRPSLFPRTTLSNYASNPRIYSCLGRIYRFPDFQRRVLGILKTAGNERATRSRSRLIVRRMFLSVSLSLFFDFGKTAYATE